MKPLSQAQIGWLCTMRDAPVGINRMAIPVGEGGSIPSLIKRGFAKWNGSTWLRITDEGRTVVEDWELCKACQEVTHIGEAACIHCGKMK